MPCGSQRLNQERTDRTMWPCRSAKRMVVTEHGPDIRICPEPLTHEFNRHNIPNRVSMSQGLFQGKCLSLPIDAGNSLHFRAFDVISPDKNYGTDVILLGIRDMNGPITLLSRFRESGIHGYRQPLLRFLLELCKRPHRLFVGEATNHAIGSLIVKLDKMKVGINLRRLKIGKVIVEPLTCQNPVHAIINVRAKHQRYLQIIILPNRFFFIMHHIQQPVRINNGVLIPLGR